MCKIDRDTLDEGRAAMTLAVCAERTEERNRLSEWIMHYCKLCGVPASVICIDTPEQLSRQPDISKGYGKARGAREIRTEYRGRDCENVHRSQDADG